MPDAVLVVKVGQSEIFVLPSENTFLDYSIRLIRFLILLGLEVEPVWHKNKIPSILG